MTWQQYNIEFRDVHAAEVALVEHIGPAMATALTAGQLDTWWFLRKSPLKLRYRAIAHSDVVTDMLTALVAAGHATTWCSGIYEPEATAFGGIAAMESAHELFHADSRHLLEYAARPGRLGKRETTVLLASTLLRAAGQDWYEQGDIWQRLSAQRRGVRTALPTDPGRAARLRDAVRQLMTAHTEPLCAPSNPLNGFDPWISSFTTTGNRLAHLARHGDLQRGLRAVLTHHVIFHANRAGLSLSDQVTIARLASDNVFADPAHVTTTRGNQMTTAPAIDDQTPDGLRQALADQLVARKAIGTPAIEAAFRAVPRHLFVPEVDVTTAYTNDAVYTKHAADGTRVSAASQPAIVAMMLGQLDAHMGHRVLEAGAGTGFNAALLGTIVGPTGHVTTIDIDDDLVEGTQRHLAAANVTNVDAIVGDGALGYPGGAPYDRIIATVGAWAVPTAWLDQLAPDGRLVVPLRLAGAACRTIAFERTHSAWAAVGSELAVFMPLRGIGDDARVNVPIADDVVLQTHSDQPVDAAAITGVLDSDQHTVWTGVTFPPNTPYEWMDLYLALNLPSSIMRMNCEPTAQQRGAVTPMFGWGAMATTRGASLAYLSIRPSTPATDGTKLYEVGVIGHGPKAHDLADEVTNLIQAWGEHYRDKTVHFTMPDAPASGDPANGKFVLRRPHHSITVTWE
jgi:protein-L-isoaspartate(D-aspartate) O-methyltransferase